MSVRRTIELVLCLLLALSGCDESPHASDAGAHRDARVQSDGGSSDAGSSDGGSSDAGSSDASSPDAGPTSSGGAGGLSCDETGDVGNGRSYCQAHLGTVDVRFIEPAGGSGPLRLGLYLHGDGAAASESGSALRVLTSWADAHHALIAAVLAPNGCAWWQAPSHDCGSSSVEVDTGHENAAALDEALRALRAAYDIYDAPVFYYGSSGGSIFLTASFIPRYGDQYPGAFSLACGGEPPWDGSLAWDPSDPRGSKLYFTYNENEMLRDDIESTISYYEGIGFPVDADVVPAGDWDHCAFDAHGRAAEVWTAYLEGR
jgi:hypothetical protein